jgi:hypothetical protein
MIDDPTQGSISGTFHNLNVGENTINLNYNFNGTPGVFQAGSFFKAIRIG